MEHSASFQELVDLAEHRRHCPDHPVEETLQCCLFAAVTCREAAQAHLELQTESLQLHLGQKADLLLVCRVAGLVAVVLAAVVRLGSFAVFVQEYVEWLVSLSWPRAIERGSFAVAAVAVAVVAAGLAVVARRRGRGILWKVCCQLQVQGSSQNQVTEQAREKGSWAGT